MPPQPTVVTGSVRTDLLLANKIPVEMDNHLHWTDSTKFFFEFLTRKMRPKSEKKNMKMEWMEVRPYPFNVTQTAIDAAAVTSINVSNPEYCHRDQLLYNPRTEEFVIVTEDIGGTAISGEVAIQGHSGTGGLVNATVVGDIWNICGEAHAEGEAIPPAYSTSPTRLFRYQMQRDRTRQNTDINRQQREYGTKQILVDRRLFWIEFKREWNFLLYFGREMREILTAAPARRHTMSGLEEQITTNRIDFSSVPGGLTVESIGEMLRRTKYEDKIGICGQNAYASVSALPMAAIRTTVSETAWGKMLKTIVTGHGSIGIGYDPVLSAENGVADKFPILDAAHLERTRMGSLDDRMFLNVNLSNDIHNEQDVASGTCGLLVHLEEMHAWCHGIQ